MRTLSSKLIFLFCLLSGISALAGRESGGGNGSAIAFRLKAYELIDQISRVPAANALCSASEMRAGLESASVQIVDVLIHRNQKVDSRLNLEAWSGPGSVQLLKEPWESYLNVNSTANPMVVNALILHEVYRTTQSCDDDNGALSSQAARLIEKAPPKLSILYSRLFAFNYTPKDFPKSYKDENQTWVMDGILCEGPISYANLQEASTCVIMVKVLNESYLRLIRIRKDSLPVPWDVLVEKRLDPNYYRKMVTQFHFANLSNPLLFIFDLQTATLTYGFSYERLDMIPD